MTGTVSLDSYDSSRKQSSGLVTTPMRTYEKRIVYVMYMRHSLGVSHIIILDLSRAAKEEDKIMMVSI